MKFARLRFAIWPMAFAIGLALVLVVLGLRIPTSQISGVAETRFVSLTPEHPFTLADLSASNLGISFAGELRLPDGTVLRDHDIALFIDDSPAPQRRFTSIPGFEVPAGAAIVAELSPREGRVVLRLSEASFDFDLLAAPGTRISVDALTCAEIPSCTTTLEAGDYLSVSTEADQPLVIQFDIPPTDIPIATRILVTSLVFWNTNIAEGRIERDSGLLAGRVRFIERPDTLREFDPGEIVTIEPADLSVRGIVLLNDHIGAQFSGAVDDLTIEIGRAEYSLMPTWFDALAGNTTVKFLAALISLIVGAEITWRSFRIRRDQGHDATRRQADTMPLTGDNDEDIPR